MKYDKFTKKLGDAELGTISAVCVGVAAGLMYHIGRSQDTLRIIN